MILSDQQREDNFQEYLRLRQDPNYYDVTFDDKSGGFIGIMYLTNKRDHSVAKEAIMKKRSQLFFVKHPISLF